MKCDFPFYLKQDYEEEEVEMPEFHFKDNRQAMNLMLAKPDGILAIIEEQTRTGPQEIDDLSGEVLMLFLILLCACLT